MHDLIYELKSLTHRHREGSYATQANRHAILHQMGEQLIAAGYKQLHVSDLKGRHINALVRQWAADGLSPATQKNRMAVLRWWATHIGKADMLKADNGAYGIAKRQMIPPASKARQLSPEGLSRSAWYAESLNSSGPLDSRQEAIKLKPHRPTTGMWSSRGVGVKGAGADHPSSRRCNGTS
jgi:site-specific recombinase XerC